MNQILFMIFLMTSNQKEVIYSLLLQNLSQTPVDSYRVCSLYQKRLHRQQNAGDIRAKNGHTCQQNQSTMLFSIYNCQRTNHGKRTEAQQIHNLRFIDIDASLCKQHVRKAEDDKIEQIAADNVPKGCIEISNTHQIDRSTQLRQ